MVFWSDVEESGKLMEQMDDLDDVMPPDCNKERYIQRVVLLEQGTTQNVGGLVV